MPDDPANLWNRWAVHLLPCITMQCGILALPFHTSTPGWEQLPVALAMLIKGDHQTIRHQLHKAEEHRIAGFEFIPQQCRSYRWSAESLPATDEQSILIHAYWGMGLHAQHPAVYGLCIRFQDSCAESKELIQRVLELTRLEPLLLARKISSVRVLVSSSRSHFLLLIAMLLLLLLCRLSLLCSLPLIHSIALFINSKPLIYCLSLTHPMSVSGFSFSSYRLSLTVTC